MGVQLKDYKIEIAKEFARFRDNRDIWDNGYDKVPNPFTEKDAKAFIALQLNKIPAQRKLIYWNNQFVGEIGITPNEDVFRLSAEMGYFIGAPFWGKGIATEAIKLMTKYIFSNFNIIRIEAGVFEFHKASMRVLEKEAVSKDPKK